MNRHCSICRISSNKRQNRIKKWKYRTHEYIQTKFAKSDSCSKRDLKTDNNHMIIHFIINWIWKHEFCNAHTLMNIDILYQLFKDIIMRLINWTITLIDEIFRKIIKALKNDLRNDEKEKNMIQSVAAIQINNKFRQIFIYTSF